jgi:hypothetical protein
VKNFLDLIGPHGTAGRTKPPGDCGGILPGMMDDLDQHVDHQ